MHYLYLFVCFLENVRTFLPGGVDPGDEELLQGFSDFTAINLPKSCTVHQRLWDALRGTFFAFLKSTLRGSTKIETSRVKQLSRH